MIMINVIIQQLNKSIALVLCVAEQKLSARPIARWQSKKGYQWTTPTRSGRNRAKKMKKTRISEKQLADRCDILVTLLLTVLLLHFSASVLMKNIEYTALLDINMKLI